MFAAVLAVALEVAVAGLLSTLAWKHRSRIPIALLHIPVLVIFWFVAASGIWCLADLKAEADAVSVGLYAIEFAVFLGFPVGMGLLLVAYLVWAIAKASHRMA